MFLFAFRPHQYTTEFSPDLPDSNNAPVCTDKGEVLV